MKRRVILYTAAALAMLSAWYFLLHAPLSQKRSEITVRTEQAKAEMLEFRRIMAELPVYLETHRNLEKTRADLNDALYAKDEILELFDVISEHARALDLEVVEITPPVEELLLLNNLLPTENKPPFLNLKISLRGDYVGFGKYVAFIENAEFFRGINLCQISRSPDDDKPAGFLLGFQALLGNTEAVS